MPVEDFAEFLANEVPKGKIVELGIGFQFKVALRLKELGYDVLAVDWNPDSVKKAGELGIKAARDDLFSPRPELYRDAKALYSVRPTPEIVGPILSLGERLRLPVYILPLTGDAMPRGMKLVNYRGLPIYVAKPI
ncbi:UPF0146 family protein [Thermococcus thioreducens]|uniref:UPF0146 protein A3L14_00925 n=1 Tax=Thermococcus thioreducens TaxID=277988 RepID=A0A0Q2QPQ4_9EURY|nr:UPF0146 family protein [Thermococcus thioreducens]ASJ11538.1 hypothetical protein A3L14_00925 [Thermococcus thioreducens]KQH81853.1 hypothetical protein AMR53_08905 [Thermococcus thioreducens]SEW04924.1 hypothetical protein SAMN05216170_1248 [Thermococcus thioreducens]